MPVTPGRDVELGQLGNAPDGLRLLERAGPPLPELSQRLGGRFVIPGLAASSIPAAGARLPRGNASPNRRLRAFPAAGRYGRRDQFTAAGAACGCN